MNHQEFIQTIHKQISLLTRDKLLTVAIRISRELYSYYQAFSEEYKWGKPEFLLDGINMCQKVLEDKPVLTEIKKVMEKVDFVTPDIDDFNEELASYALNAATSVYESLAFVLDNDISHITNIISYYTDTIDFKIQEDKDLTPDEIDNHPLMIKAWQFLLAETQT